MREIKFRVWDKVRDYWCGSYAYIDENGDVYTDDVIKTNTSSEEIAIARKGRYIIEQYTGLKDKNGKEIYEGDIVASMNGRWMGTVVYQAPKFVIKQKPQSKTWYEFSLSPEENQFQEIIGNIHEEVQE